MLPTFKPSDAEENHIAVLLSDGLEKAVDTWCSLSHEEQDATDILKLQTTNVLTILNQLGLSLTTLASLNTQNSAIFPVKHVEHYKGGQYLVLGSGIHTETEEKLTVYCKEDKTEWYMRPIDMFHGCLSGTKKLRFTKRIMARLIERI